MPRTSEKAKSSPDDKLLEKLFNSTPDEWAVSASPSGQLLSDIGPVSTMVIPADWRPGRQRHNTLGLSFYEEYTPPGEPETILYFYFRGVPLEPEQAGAFKQVLKAPPHTLSEAEVEKIKPLLAGKASPDAFEILSLATELINGKHVLMLTGIYKGEEKPMIELFVDLDGSGSLLHEIEYQAPLDKYTVYLPQMEAAFKSLSWK